MRPSTEIVNKNNENQSIVHKTSKDDFSME